MRDESRTTPQAGRLAWEGYVRDFLTDALLALQGGYVFLDSWIQCPRRSRPNSISSALFRSDTTQYVISAPFQWRIW
jgi:hypothetical protein